MSGYVGHRMNGANKMMQHKKRSLCVCPVSLQLYVHIGYIETSHLMYQQQQSDILGLGFVTLSYFSISITIGNSKNRNIKVSGSWWWRRFLVGVSGKLKVCHLRGRTNTFH